jgi:hypothetical protein
MSRKYPNRTGQSATFETGTPDAVDISGTTALAGMRTFAAVATADSWVDGDTVTILVKKSDDDYQIWTATWDETNDKLLKVTAEMSVGTISDTNVVEVSAVLSQAGFAEATSPLLKVEVLQDETRTLTIDDCGRLFLTHDTMGGSTIEVPGDLPDGTWFRVDCRGLASATVTLLADVFGGELGNGTDETVSVPVGENLFVYKYDSGQWNYIQSYVPPPEE